ncbi:MAG: HAMP domain-containing histidine kinase [FCB group bacterium]|nr:HAMP domain-containing histidine kinase [FCB group bacterium]
MKTELSLQRRITLWSTLVVSLIFIVFIVLVILALDNQLKWDLDHRIDEEANAVELSIFHTDSGISIDESIEWREPHHQDMDDESMVLMILNENLHLIRRSPNFPFSPELIQSFVFDPTDSNYYTRSFMDLEMRFLVKPIPFANQTLVWIIVGKSFNSIHQILKEVFTIFLFSFPVALIMVYWGSLFLARKSLRPVRAISEKARQFKSSNLSQRLPVPRTDDDIAHLAITLNELLDRLETTVVSLRNIAANASHEIKTPVTILYTYLDRWAQTHPDMDTHEILSFRSELNRITKIIDNLSQIAKTDSGAAKLQFDTVWMNDLLYEEIERFRPQALMKDITIQVKPLPSVAIEGDESWLHLALGNLIENALKYSPEHSSISLKMESTDAHTLMVTISDEGHGVPEQDLELLTARYFRSKQSRPGTGLGLAIAHWVVQQHHGKLRFANNPTGGLTVQVCLPEQYNPGT